MFVVWEQFNHVQMGLQKEASALEDRCHVAGSLSERDSANRTRLALRRYVKATASDEPQRPSIVTMSWFIGRRLVSRLPL